MSNYLTHEAEVTVVIDERRQFWRPWRKKPVRIVVWRGYIVGYRNDYDRGASIELSDMSHGVSRRETKALSFIPGGIHESQ